MLSSILRSKRTVQVNVGIMRTFVKLREMLATNEELARKVAQHDRQIAVLFDHVQKMLAPAPVKKNPIGYIIPRTECRQVLSFNLQWESCLRDRSQVFQGGLSATPV